jgi:hypothetical protein
MCAVHLVAQGAVALIMSKPARATLTETPGMRPLRVRGRPVCEVSRAALIKEIERLHDQVAKLQATILMDREMRYRPFNADAMQGTDKPHGI